MYLIDLSTITALAICFGDLMCGYASRQKKQLSPALQLQDDINSLLRLNELSPKRSSGDQPYVLPVMNLDNLLSLQNIGKRPALSPADQFIQQFDIMQHLMAAGKKRSVSPATDLEEQIKIPQVLIDVADPCCGSYGAQLAQC
ncbi:Neuropeptide-like peptide [Dirofilaria immitis]